jgi:DNA polymerase V
MSRHVPIIPIVPVAEGEAGRCAGAEPFVLVVLGESMAPEFLDGDVIVVEPEGFAIEGSFVVARLDDGWSLRQLARTAVGWELRALHPAHPSTPIPDLSPVRGVVIQKSVPGRRRERKRYVE